MPCDGLVCNPIYGVFLSQGRLWIYDNPDKDTALSLTLNPCRAMESSGLCANDGFHLFIYSLFVLIYAFIGLISFISVISPMPFWLCVDSNG